MASNIKIWLISDTHFNHANIIKYCNRPFSTTEEMNHTLIQHWNSVVQSDDIVYHLGDVALTSEAHLTALLAGLNGHKHLIRGNHDSKSRDYYLRAGFETVQPYLVLDYNGRTIYLTHHPESRIQELGLPQDALHFYGHVHNNMLDVYPPIARNGACLCAELWDYTPQLLDEIVARCNAAPTTCPAI